MIRVPSRTISCRSANIWGVRWETGDFLDAHRRVKASGKYNFEGCRIPIPTPIRHDRIREDLGVAASPKELRVLGLLEFGMPFNCKLSFGVKRRQKKHFSTVSYKQAIDGYIKKNFQCQALLGPFKESPIPSLCFSPLMSVPKEVSNAGLSWIFRFLRVKPLMTVSRSRDI